MTLHGAYNHYKLLNIFRNECYIKCKVNLAFCRLDYYFKKKSNAEKKKYLLFVAISS